MKLLHNLIGVGSISILLGNLMADPSLAALPLQVGVYHGGGSRYIQIAQQNNRICYKGMSPNGVTIASVAPHAKQQNFYAIYGMQDLVLLQSDINTLLFGQVNQLSTYKADYSFSRDIDPNLQKCLNSQEPFRQQFSGSRGSR